MAQVRQEKAEAQNKAPVATFTNLAAQEDQATNGVLTATDADGDVLTFALVSNPSHGTLLLQSNGTFSYIPASDYFGSDSFSYSVSDGKSTVQQAVTITVVNTNDAPVFSSPMPTLNLTQGVAMTPVVLPAAADADNDPLTYSVT